MVKKRMPKGSPGEKRRKAIMDAAWEMFLEKGYAAVSVDEIIRASGGSKSTLYEFFGSKKGLFLELIASVSDEILREVEGPAVAGLAPAEALARFGMAACSQILTKKGIGLYTLSVSVAKTFPEVARLFYESGPKLTQQGLAAYIEKEAAAGRLRVKDPVMAAEFFLGMILVKHHISMPMGGRGPTKAERESIVREAVSVFLSAYGA